MDITLVGCGRLCKRLLEFSFRSRQHLEHAPRRISPSLDILFEKRLHDSSLGEELIDARDWMVQVTEARHAHRLHAVEDGMLDLSLGVAPLSLMLLD